MRAIQTTDSAVVDELDRAIVHCLQLHGRASFRRIADLLGVSEQTVARRYRRMRSGGILRVLSLVSPQSFGQTSWVVRIQSRPDSTAALAQALADRGDVSWVTIGAGGADITAALHARSTADRDDLVLERLPRHAQVLSLTVHSMMHRFARPDGVDWTVQSPRVDVAIETALLGDRPSVVAEARLTPDDEPLIAAITADGRATVAELAERSGWSEARANRRLQALLGSGAVYLDVDIAQDVFGFTNSVGIWLTVEPRHLREVGQALVALPEIAFCAAITGNINLQAFALFTNSGDLYEFVTQRIGPLPGVRQAEISPVFRQIKQAGSFVERARLTGVPTRR